MDFPFFASPNFSPGRKKKIKGIILHRSHNNLEKTVTTCFSPNSFESYHFLITRTGKIIQLVKCHDTAWHAGWITKESIPTKTSKNNSKNTGDQNIPHYLFPNPNFSSIGIALIDENNFTPKTRKNLLWTLAQQDSLKELLRYLNHHLKIPLSPEHLLPHSLIDPLRNSNDPGDYLDFKALLKMITPQLREANNFKNSFTKFKKERSSNEHEKLYFNEVLIKKTFRGLLNRDPNLSEIDYYKYANLDLTQITRKIIQTEEFRNRIIRK